jgi:hypothetical protein
MSWHSNEYVRVEGVDDETHQLRNLSLEGKGLGVVGHFENLF